MKNPIAVPTSAVARNALVIIACVAAGAAIYWLRDILTPLAMAIFLMIMIDGVKRVFEHRLHLSSRVAGLLSLAMVILAFFASIAIIANGALGFFDEATGVTTRIGPRLDQILSDIWALFGSFDPPTTTELINQIDFRAYIGQTAMQAQNSLSGGFFVLIYLGFLLASQYGFRRKIIGMFPNREARAEAAEVFERVRSGVEGYLWVQTVTGLLICAVAWAMMKAIGLQNAEFWTFVIFIVGYIPMVGGAVAGCAPPLFALVQFESYWPAVILLVGLQVLLFLVGNLVQPRMQGDNQNIDPITVLLSLALWGKLWGVIGMFLSTPLAVMAMAVLAEFQGSRWIAVLLSGDGEPYRDVTEEKQAAASRRATEDEDSGSRP